MGYRNLQECVRDLQKARRLVCVDEPIDPHLEAAEIQRRVYASGGPAVLFTQVLGCRFPMVSNLFGTADRARFMFRDSWDRVRRLIELKVDPTRAFRSPLRYLGSPWTALSMLPRGRRRGAVMANHTTLDQLPQLTSWPDDGGAFITLPQVYTEHAERRGWLQSNLGMYRIQISGGKYARNREIGLHYQLHRSIGVHHAAAKRIGQPFPVNIFVGGTPAMTLAAVMPLPEGMSELTFAGALAGHRIGMVRGSKVSRQEFAAAADCQPLPIYGEADFAITGIVDPVKMLPEGPFGDHLGYYSLTHDFPVLNVQDVFHRDGAVWPFTVVGRPPQEDTVFGQLIHELTGDVIPTVIPGVDAVHAVDAAGVHPLLLAIGNERYTPYRNVSQPQELLTQANAILGQGQLSLAKYLMIAAGNDDPQLNLHDIPGFLQHVLRRVDWRRDLHFQTRTTIDTLDYSGSSLNEGSKVIIAAAGPAVRELPVEMRANLKFPDRFQDPRVCLPGILAIKGRPATSTRDGSDGEIERFCQGFSSEDEINRFPLIAIVDDSDFCARSVNNLLWTVFTRSNPAADIFGIGAETKQKHWGCSGALVIDARIKSHHSPPLVEDPQVTRKIDAMAARGGPLAKYL